MVFGQDFEKMGGTVTGPVSHKKGVLRFVELFVDNMARLLVTGLISVASMIPCAAGMAVSAMLNVPLFLLLAGIIGGAIMGPFYGAMMDGIMMSLRDYSGSWWERYCFALKRDWKGNLVPGIILGCLAAVAVDVLLLFRTTGALPAMMLPCVIISLVLGVAIFTYLWPQRVMLDLKLFQILRNCLFLIMAHPAVTLGAVAIQAVYWLIILLCYPYSGIFLLITGVWFPALAGSQIIYGSLNKDFKMEERLGDVDPEKLENSSN